MMQIGQLAAQTGFSTKTIRYYETVGLISPHSRSDSGYRLYDEAAVERLRFVSRARALGIPLEDIGRVLEISDEGRVPCEHAVAVVERELAGIDRQMKRLREVRRGLHALRARLAGALASGEVGPGQRCPCFEEANDVRQM